MFNLKPEEIDERLNSLFTTQTQTPKKQEIPKIIENADAPKKSKTSELNPKPDSKDLKAKEISTERNGAKKRKAESETENNEHKKEKQIEIVKEKPSRRMLSKQLVSINERTLFVGNLSIEAVDKKKEFESLFEGVESIRFRSIAFANDAKNKMPRKVQFITKNFHEKRDTMNAYIVFKTKELAQQQLSKNGTVFLGKHLRIDKLDKEFNSQQSLFVGNLPFDVTEESLFKFFEDAGDIESVRIIRDKKTNVGKGFGYVQFLDKSSVELGLKLDGSELDGRKLRVIRSKESLANSGKVIEGARAIRDDVVTLGHKKQKKEGTDFKKAKKPKDLVKRPRWTEAEKLAGKRDKPAPTAKKQVTSPKHHMKLSKKKFQRAAKK